MLAIQTLCDHKRKQKCRQYRQYVIISANINGDSSQYVMITVNKNADNIGGTWSCEHKC